MNVNLKSLIGKMNDATRSALEAAAGLCLSRTHYEIEIEHFLTKLLDRQDSDLAHILKRFEIDKSRFTGELNRALDKLKTGNARTPAFSPSLVKLLTTAWTIGSIDYGALQLRSGFAVLALVADDEMARLTRDFSRELPLIQPETLRREFFDIVVTSPEGTTASSAGAPAAAPAAGDGKAPNLDQYTVNLTENAKKGKIDTVLGRDSEIRQIVDILMRRRQ
ncbi:MAG: Clp protease N-terminal domain-containing protein, partial [Bryobacteraceae bacterium]